MAMTPSSASPVTGSDMMQQTEIGFNNKPCSACRRRKVRCDKSSSGCSHCVKQGLECMYDSGDAAVVAALAYGSHQQALHERVERLERAVRDMSATCRQMRRQQLPHHRRRFMATGMPSPSLDHGGAPSWSLCKSHSAADGEESGMMLPGGGLDDHDDLLSDIGFQIFDTHTSYYMTSSFWMNLHGLLDDPHGPFCSALLRQDGHVSPPRGVWPFATETKQGLADPTHMRLPLETETTLLDYFFAHVHPFFNCVHRQSWREALRQFRAGASPIIREFEAAMFCQQLLAVVAMAPDQVRRATGKTRTEMVLHLRSATEAALARADILRTRKPVAFQALLYYMCFLYLTGQAEAATMLTGLAGRLAMRLGLHRDSSHYTFSPSVGETRRRLWNLLVLLDSQIFNGEGAESSLDLVSDVQLSINADDAEWTEISPPVEGHNGFTELTPSIVSGETVNLARRLSRMASRSALPDEMYQTVNAAEACLTMKLLGQVDEMCPLQVATMSRFRADMAYQRLSISLHALGLSNEPTVDQLSPLFTRSVEMLEEWSRGEALAVAHNYGWLYTWPVPWNALAFVLTGLVQLTEHPDADRAWVQIDAAFRRHGSPDVAAWRVIEQLCDQAMAQHPGREHSGASYTRRSKIARPSIRSTGVPVTPPHQTGPGEGRRPGHGSSHVSPLSVPSQRSDGGFSASSGLYAEADMYSSLEQPGSSEFCYMTQGYGDMQSHQGLISMDGRAGQTMYYDWGAHESAGY